MESMRQYTVVYGNRTTETQSTQRTNERRRLLLRSKYAILFKYCNKDEFHVSANSASLRLIIVAEKSTLAVYGNKTTESQSAQRTNDGDDYLSRKQLVGFSRMDGR